MKKKIGKVLIITGILLILSAILLCIYNFREGERAFEQSQEVLTELKNIIPEHSQDTFQSTSEIIENPADDLFAPYEEEEEKAPEPVEIDGSFYCGYITFPTLGLELPVADELSYPALKNSPCRFSGIAVESDLIIAAHNYNSHFGRIGDLNSGDEIIFTDTLGMRYHYEVDHTQFVDGTDAEEMFSGQAEEWDITLFTCTLSGRSRVTVRGVKR